MEGDYGQDDKIFLSDNGAKEWARAAYEDYHDIDEECLKFDEFWADYCFIRKITLVRK